MATRRHLLVFLLSCLSIGWTERIKRELRFPKGASLDVAVALTSFLPKGITEGLSHDLEFHLGYPFPQQLNIDRIDEKDKEKPGTLFKKYRPKRNVKDEQRIDLILKVEDAITRVGYNGAACVSRFRCELQQGSPSSLLEELLLSLFTTSTRFGDRECKEFASKCTVSLLHVILHSEQI